MSGSMGMILVPAASGVGAVLLAVTQQDRPLIAAAGLLVLAASIAVGLAMVIGSRTGTRRRTRVQRERYLDYLEQARHAARDGADQQRTNASLMHPGPAVAASMAWQPTRRWERRPTDADFLVLRAGLGLVPLDRRVTLQVDANDPLTAHDPVCLAAAQELAAAYAVLADQPICLPLDGAVLSVIGPVDRVRGIVRALLAQLVWAHSPHEVAVLACDTDGANAWDWLKWLPHSLSSHARDGPLPARLITSTALQALELLTGEIAERVAGPVGGARRVVVVMDQLADQSPPALDVAALCNTAKAVGAAQIHLLRNRRSEPERVDIRLLAADPAAADGGCPDTGAQDLVEFGATRRSWCRLDDLDMAGVAFLARAFAPLRAGDEGLEQSESRLRLVDPLRFGDVASIDPAVSWRRRVGADLLRVPIGTAIDGSPVVLDLKESAQGGMGPHGLVVGATGSGKSELLRTLVTALAIGHPPQSLALLLADFKGGATFSGLARLPHVAGMITNLEADLSLVDRFRDALGGEIQRRQEMLAAAGKLTSLASYLELRRRRPELAAIPHLLVIVDEFSELLGAKPDLADLFVTIGRIGRSIGVHLLLATQRLDTGRIRGLESHLSFRVCLRTFSESESREAIGSADAYHLPAEPGWGYLRGDSPEQRLFRAVTVSRPYRRPSSSPVQVGTPILPFGAHDGTAARISALHNRQLTGTPSRPAGGTVGTGSADRRPERTVLDIAVDRLTALSAHSSQGQPARRVWLDPLPRRLILSDLLARCESQPEHVAAVLGLADIPERQRQEIVDWDFTEGNSNLLIVGAGRSGKSTTARTLLVSLALRYSPLAVQVICVDFGGETLVPLGELPHVSAVATRSDPELTGRVFSRIVGLLTEREALFRRHRFESTAALRRARAAGNFDPSVAGDIVLIIDGWAGVGESDGVPDGAVEEILRRGPGVGIHTVLTVASPSQLRARLIGGFGGRIELKLSDSFDSAIDRQLAKSLPAETPGRALVAGRHYAQLALPLLSAKFLGQGSPPGADQAAALISTMDPVPQQHSAEHVIAAVHSRWPGQPAPRIRTLPEMVSLTDLQAMVGTGELTPPLILGLAEGDSGPLRHNVLGGDPHLIVYGDGRSGKTTVLRSLLTQFLEADTSSGAVDVGRPYVVIVDYRRDLAVGAGGRTPALTVATDPDQAVAACGSVAATLANRINEQGGTRHRGGPNAGSRTTGARAVHQSEIYLLIDDYDLVATTAGNPLLALLPYLPHGADIGFHLVLARRTGGAARAQYEAVGQSLGDLGTPVLMLSGSPTEGRLAHGLVPRVLPAGRARLATRSAEPQLIQTAWVGAIEP